MTRYKKEVKYFTKQYPSYDINSVESLLKRISEFCLEYKVASNDISISIGYDRGYYESVDQYLEFTGSRLETDEELDARIKSLKELESVKNAQKKQNKLLEEEKERAELARLKAKYER